MKSLINTFTITFVSVAILLLALDLTIVPALELFFIPFMALFSSFFESFLRFRDLFIGESKDVATDLLERINKMAIDLSQLVAEVDRVSSTHEKAVEKITALVSDVKAVTEQLVEKTKEAENTVDVEVINSLVEKLKASTDSLSAVLEPPPTEEPVAEEPKPE
jgi:methyl-accepting chemotaxis protein